jgi:RNA polymerase sigma-70 factor (ECF subfamily)
MGSLRGRRHDDERALARRFAAGDPAALEEVYDRYAGPVLTVALSRLGGLRDRHLADEVVQDVFLKAWRAAARFDASRPLGPWLYEIARRAAADAGRHRRRRPTTSALPDHLADEAATLSDAWEAWQVRSALRDLPADDRVLLHLTHYVGLTQSQVAARLGLPLGTVKSRLHRAHHGLAAVLAHLRAEDVG